MNYKNIKSKKFIFITLLVTICVSCEDFLEEKPKGTLTSAIFWDNDENAIGAINAVYARGLSGPIREQTWNFWFETAALDYGYWWVPDYRTGIINGTWNPNTFHFQDLWDNSYPMISRANFVLGNLPNAQIDPKFKKRLEGEARFLRAWRYFDLVRSFGDVPLVMKPAGNSGDMFPEKTSSDIVYDTIVSDLTHAIGLLPLKSEYSMGEDKGRASKGAAQAMLAKVYLTLANWEKVLELTDAVIQSNEYRLYDDYAQVFTPKNDNGDEWIFSYQSAGLSNSTTHQTSIWGFPAELNGIDGFGQGFGNLTLSPDLVSVFDPNDKRFKEMVWTYYVTQAGDTIKFQKGGGFFCKKYDDPTISQDYRLTRINYPVLRYSDVLLMFAEAKNELNPLDQDAFDKLNQVKSRAGLGSLTVADLGTKDAFLNEVLDERRKEFFGENQRLWDLKRRGLFLDWVRKKPFSQHAEHMNLFPIPQNEIDANPNLTQNPGY